MLHHVKLLIWCVLVSRYYAVRLPVSPCPNVFIYEEDQLDRWYGLITFASNSELTGLDLKIQLDRPSQLLVSWDGDVRTKDNMNYIIRNPFHTQKVGEMVKCRIMVKYYSPNGPPNVVRIDINSKTLCSRDTNFGQGIGLSSESTTERFDPVFNENDNIDYNNNRGQSGGSSANRPSYNNFNSNVNNNNRRPIYTGNNEPNYNHNPPIYNFPEHSSTGGSNSPSYNPNTGSVKPNDYDSTNSGFSSSDFNAESVSSGGGQSSDTSTSNFGNGPVVTTLTLPTNMQNKTNIDQIVQIIKNQLEQQQLTANQGNKTVIVAVVNPNLTSSSSQINNVSFEQTNSSVRTSSVNSTTKYKTNTTIKPTAKPSSNHRNGNTED